MSPRRSAAEAQHTKDSILSTAMDIASLDGLEGVTIGRLATELAMSKSGVLNHFSTKQTLQLAAVHHVIAEFQERVIEPAMRHPAGLERLLALCDNWFDYLADTGLPGGCLLTAAATEFDGREGEVHDAVLKSWRDWRSFLRAEIHRAQLDIDADQAVFEIVSFGPGLNQALQLHGDQAAITHARRAVRRTLGQPDSV
ncbi:TetR/AcrR family transcriptional regulator [Kibdelosporangium philippinense]|uniref:TetR/AcrR family transcriptional regulator n=1 Tax=Kibdelosporangium philippinense TaxID=211113 RepID=A0ABS8ZP88_9PSEU|nr:TetR family transcriptional regulator [Kibdelosporangium philippinense]MCE7009570.1 TetR/AcrR family transcriptional regulator [Kibdelosporangium philippinense]